MKKCLILFHYYCLGSFQSQNWEILMLKVVEILWYFLIKKYMPSDLNMSHGKMSDSVSFSLFGFTLVIKLRNFDFQSHWNTLIFFFFLDKKWRQIWLRPVKQYLFWFKLCCLSRMLVINWEIWILNFIEIVYIFELRNLVPDRNLPQFFCLNCILWHYYRNCFELKMFLIILRFIEILYRKFCIWRAVSGCWPRTNE